MSRPRLNLQKSQCRDWDRDWIYKSLNFETKTETESLWVSMSRPRPRLENLLFLLWNSKNIWVSISRPRQRLKNFFFCYEILFMSRPKVIKTRKFCGCRDRDSSRLGNSLVVETETHRDWEILWLSRPRLIETGKFCGCRDRDSSRLGNFVVVETETKRDWEFLWLSRPRPVETEQKLSRPRLHRESRWSLVRDAVVVVFVKHI